MHPEEFFKERNFKKRIEGIANISSRGIHLLIQVERVHTVPAACVYHIGSEVVQNDKAVTGPAKRAFAELQLRNHDWRYPNFAFAFFYETHKIHAKFIGKGFTKAPGSYSRWSAGQLTSGPISRSSDTSSCQPHRVALQEEQKLN
jgi:hypothetical protein